MSTVPPIRREVLVDALPQAAFDVFTEGIGRWWPIAGHSVHGAGGTVAFTGGQLVEQSAAGQRCVWGTVTRWEPPAVVAFTCGFGTVGRWLAEPAGLPGDDGWRTSGLVFGCIELAGRCQWWQAHSIHVRRLAATCLPPTPTASRWSRSSRPRLSRAG